MFQLVEGFPDIQRLKTDVFRERVRYSQQVKEQLAAARKGGADAVRAVETGLGNIADADSGSVIDLFLSYRAVKAWNDMIALVDRMAPPLAATVMVREQLGLALNRAGRGEEAERVLTSLIEERGPSSETYGILGRVYKDRWEAALKAGESFRARGLLNQAITAYLRGLRNRLAGRISRRQRGHVDGAEGSARPASRRAHPGGALRGRAAHRRPASPITGTTRRSSSSPCSPETRRAPCRRSTTRSRSCVSRGSPRPPLATCG